MKILNTYTMLPDLWRIEFTLGANANGSILEIRAGDAAVLTTSIKDGLLTATIHTVWKGETPRFGKDPEMDFMLTSPKTSGHVGIAWRGYSFRLYMDGKLQDEEWPLGDPLAGDWTVKGCDAVSGLSLSEETVTVDPEEIYDKPFQNFVTPGHNTGVGDCMPFGRDGRYCLYYLFDRRGHKSKCGLGAHQWALVSSADLKIWTIHPMSVGITKQWEGSICTGSLIQKDGKTYAFYAVRTSDGTPAQMTWAVSDDGITFEKSDKYFALTAPYEPVSARDPMVFLGADGLYHMLVTTSLVDRPDLGGYDGCLAHLTSPDLMDWTQLDPFIIPGYADQPECSDYFEWNGWYYLVFSNFATARYRMSRNPFGPWIRPASDELDALEVQVPKTAPYGDRRFSTGFLGRRPRTYAGNAVTHELYQRADGTLAIKHLEDILPAATEVSAPNSLLVEAGQNRATADLPALASSFRLKATLKPETAGMLMGISVRVGGCEYRIDLDPAAGTACIVRPRENFDYGSGRDRIANVPLADGTTIDLIVSGDILDMTLADGRVMTMRLEQNASDGATTSFYAIGGTLEVKEITLLKF